MAKLRELQEYVCPCGEVVLGRHPAKYCRDCAAEKRKEYERLRRAKKVQEGRLPILSARQE